MSKICRNLTCSNVVTIRRVCNTCASKAFRLKHEATAAYLSLKNNAKRRGKEFTLTLEEWKKFCSETNYLQLRGTLPEQSCVDRKDATKGYSYDNLQILTNSQNGIKGNTVDKKALQKVRVAFVWTDNPFTL